MNTEDFVTYEQALALKKLGFRKDWDGHLCDYYYVEYDTFDKDGKPQVEGRLTCKFSYHFIYCRSIAAPTLAQAQKWLRKVKEIDVLVFNCSCGYGWEISKANPESRGTGIAIFDDMGEDENSGMWLSYESALSAGISKALKLLGKED